MTVNNGVLIIAILCGLFLAVSDFMGEQEHFIFGGTFPEVTYQRVIEVNNLNNTTYETVNEIIIVTETFQKNDSKNISFSDLQNLSEKKTIRTVIYLSPINFSRSDYSIPIIDKIPYISTRRGFRFFHESGRNIPSFFLTFLIGFTSFLLFCQVIEYYKIEKNTKTEKLEEMVESPLSWVLCSSVAGWFRQKLKTF